MYIYIYGPTRKPITLLKRKSENSEKFHFSTHPLRACPARKLQMLKSKGFSYHVSSAIEKAIKVNVLSRFSFSEEKKL